MCAEMLASWAGEGMSATRPVIMTLNIRTGGLATTVTTNIERQTYGSNAVFLHEADEFTLCEVAGRGCLVL